MNNYLEFISDKDLFECIKELHKTYIKVKEEATLKQFYKNKVDPIRFNFDMLFNNLDYETIISNEIMRQKEKTISNAIGIFHENLIGCIDGYTNMPVGYGYDIKKNDGTIFAEIKNKFNTVKGEDLKNIHNKLSSIANENPDAVCYFVQIIAKKSINEVWEITSKGKKYKHNRVRIISADKFYEILTGDKNAFKKICDILPKVTKDYLNICESENTRCSEEENIEYDVVRNNLNLSVYDKLKHTSDINKTDILGQIFNDTFDKYNGFNSN